MSPLWVGRDGCRGAELGSASVLKPLTVPGQATPDTGVDVAFTRVLYTFFRSLPLVFRGNCRLTGHPCLLTYNQNFFPYSGAANPLRSFLHTHVSSSESHAALPRWIPLWLGAIPAMYFLTPLTSLALPALRRLPRAAQFVLLVYALSQQVPALFSPEPVLASLLALARTALMIGMVAVGVVIGTSERLKSVTYGLIIIYLTTLIFSLISGLNPLASRLIHPYMTSVAIGIAGAYGIWIALFIGGSLWWRWILGMSGLGILLLSGSRGPLIAALAGVLAGFAVQRIQNVVIGLLITTGLFFGSVYVGERFDLEPIGRLTTTDTTGRDVIWYNALTLIRAHPWSGVGSYRLGKYLAGPAQACPQVQTNPSAAHCPDWVQHLGTLWFIAHNVTMHQLAESGPLGLFGLFLLLASIVGSTLTSGQPLASAVIFGMLISNFTDNTLLLPSPFFGELFWVVAGIQLLHFRVFSWRESTIGIIILFALSFPSYASLLFKGTEKIMVRINYLSVPAYVSKTGVYAAHVQFALPPGTYRASLNSCRDACMDLQTQFFQVGSVPMTMLSFDAVLPSRGRQKIQLRLLAGKSTLRSSPLALREWLLVADQFEK